MDSKTEDEGRKHKRTGPAAPPPPPPLEPMKLPPAHGSKAAAGPVADSPGADAKSNDPVDIGETAAERSLAKRLVSTVVDDGDIIEKEWVEKARKIAEAYRGDPHRQSEELSILRANYMDKRFGKTVKLSK